MLFGDDFKGVCLNFVILFVCTLYICLIFYLNPHFNQYKFVIDVDNYVLKSYVLAEYDINEMNR